MKRINFFPGQVFALTQYNFISSTRAVNIRLCERNINIFNSNLFSFSTFCSLLREKEGFKNKSRDSTPEKRRENRAPIENAKISQSNEKNKTLQKTKSLTVRPEINYNDLQIKVKQIQKFINKGMLVSVKVDNPKNLEECFEGIFSQLQKSITEHQISAKMTRTGPVINIYPISSDGNLDEKFKEGKGNRSSNLNSENEKKS